MASCLQKIPSRNESRVRKEKMMKCVFQTLAIDRDGTTIFERSDFNSKSVCFLFAFVWLKILATKQKLKAKFVTFMIKLCNMVLISILTASNSRN